MSNTSIVVVKNLNVWFGQGRQKQNAVKNVSISVSEGESFGLVGESGSGKTTVLNALAGLLHTWDGEMTIDGRSLAPNQSQFCRNVQMVFQDPYGSLHPRHTVYNVLREPLIIHKMDEIESRIVNILEEVGLDASYRFRYPHQLSGGQRQRVAIARALIIEPTIILLDEPTSALDVSVQAEVLNLLQRLKKERHLTYLIVSHDLAVIAHMCSNIAVMQHGRIVEILNRDQLVNASPEHPYTLKLLNSSQGYERERAAV